MSDLNKIPFPRNKESTVYLCLVPLFYTPRVEKILTFNMTQLFNRMQDLEKNRKRDMAQRGIMQLFWGLLAILFIYLVMDITSRKV
ncbi:uncharacterized protein Bfra_011562 [Botrytis fragariae]|uniref:Uncharacterized protein n=1 Tax=Botrytis fragariae TaxID=1964551 RepID=A0A8H6AYK7_9HELO|nr:uncharacterized protein Bfra_011562 [Botrytis fragariae]KAF5875800.1 hypothetical protein Bfra_011562 [Botrytis fragariae]